MEKYLDTNKNDTESKSFTAINLFSAKFCLHVCSMLLHNIDEGEQSRLLKHCSSSYNLNYVNQCLLRYRPVDPRIYQAIVFFNG